MRNPATKIFQTIEDALEWRQDLRNSGKTLAITNGCFDIMHRGHAQYLYNAATHADAMLVLINGDDSISRLKGPSRPIVKEENRTYMLASLECIDGVLVFNDKRATKFFELLKPDVYIKGADYTEETLDREEYAALKEAGAKFEFIEFVPGCSTSILVEKIKADQG